MLFGRVFSMLLIAAALMVLGFDALTALETGNVNPLSLSELSRMIGGAMGLGTMLDLEAGLRAMPDWPQWLRGPLLFIVTSPAFVVLAIIGIVSTWLFRHRD